jgi:hypothetical protein
MSELHPDRHVILELLQILFIELTSFDPVAPIPRFVALRSQRTPAARIQFRQWLYQLSQRNAPALPRALAQNKRKATLIKAFPLADFELPNLQGLHENHCTRGRSVCTLCARCSGHSLQHRQGTARLTQAKIATELAIAAHASKRTADWSDISLPLLNRFLQYAVERIDEVGAI